LSPNVISFLGVVLLYNDTSDAVYDANGVVAKSPMKALILDFIKLNNRHTGENMARKLVKCLKEFGIVKKVSILAC
jgi:hypothetical protein